jgi:hypothetical protein
VNNIDCRQDGVQLGGGPREAHLFNSTVEGIERADAILIIGSNPRIEAPVLNARIRKAWGKAHLAIGVIGEAADLTYPYQHLGTGAQALGDTGSWDRAFLEAFQRAERPAIIVGPGALAGPWAVRPCGRSPGWRRPSTSCARAGTASTCCTRRRAASPASTWASCRRTAGWIRPAWSGGGAGRPRPAVLAGRR